MQRASSMGKYARRPSDSFVFAHNLSIKSYSDRLEHLARSFCNHLESSVTT